ncbi:hypothetical protein TGPRC2_359890, partial [Toxoplasma gondii TgCatPRC2]
GDRRRIVRRLCSDSSRRVCNCRNGPLRLCPGDVWGPLRSRLWRRRGRCRDKSPRRGPLWRRNNDRNWRRRDKSLRSGAAEVGDRRDDRAVRRRDCPRGDSWRRGPFREFAGGKTRHGGTVWSPASAEHGRDRGTVWSPIGAEHGRGRGTVWSP